MSIAAPAGSLPAGTKCGVCKAEPAIGHMPPPIGSVNAAFPLPIGQQCDVRLTEALNDLAWLRFVLSRYVPAGPQAPRWAWLNQ